MTLGIESDHPTIYPEIVNLIFGKYLKANVVSFEALPDRRYHNVDYDKDRRVVTQEIPVCGS